jgi:hypothetical protein
MWSVSTSSRMACIWAGPKVDQAALATTDSATISQPVVVWVRIDITRTIWASPRMPLQWLYDRAADGLVFADDAWLEQAPPSVPRAAIRRVLEADRIVPRP